MALGGAFGSFKAILVLSAVDDMTSTVRSTLGKNQAAMAKFGSKAKSAGRDMMTGGAMIAAPLVLATREAIKFESSFAGVRKTVSASEAEFATMQKQLLEMSRIIPVNVNELNAIAEAAGQLGIENKNIVQFTRTIADLRATTNLGDDAATIFARFANITKMPQSEFDRLGSTIVDLGNNLATTESEIAEFGLRIAGAGAQVGISQAKILGIGAALSSVGVGAEAGGTAVSKVIGKMAQAAANGGPMLEKMGKVAGVSGAEFAKIFKEDASEALTRFIEGIARIKDEGGNVFATLDKMGMGEIRLRDAILRTAGAGDLLRRSLKISEGAWNENNALTNEAAQRYGTAESKIEVFKNAVVALAIPVGQLLVPVLTRLAEILIKVADWVSGLTEKYPRLTKALVIGAAAFAALLVTAGAFSFVMGTIASAISAVSIASGIWTVVTKVAAAAQWLLNAALSANPIGAVVVGIIGVIAATILLIKHWDKVKAWIVENKLLFATIIGPWVIAMQAFIHFGMLIAGTVKAIKWLKATADDLPGAFKRLGSEIGTVLWNLTKTVAAAGWEMVKSLVASFFNIGPSMREGGSNMMSSLLEGMKSGAGKVVDFMGNLASGIRDYLPFSPAKTGALRDIHRIRLIETVADGMSPDPMVKAMRVVAQRTRDEINPGSGGAIARAIIPSAIPNAIATPSAGSQAQGGGISVNFAPVINMTGGDPKSVRDEIAKMLPEITRSIERVAQRKKQVSFADAG